MKSLLQMAVALATVGSVQAASIAWSSLGSVSNATDVLNIGTVVQAEYAGGFGSQTVNGVTFLDGFTSYATAAGVGTGAFLGDTGNSSYNTILNTFAYDGTSPGVLTLNSLSIGVTYKVQLWALDDRPDFGIPNRTQRYDDNAGNFSATFFMPSNTIMLGTFTADAITQVVNVSGAAQLAHNLNAFEVVAVPEPSSWAMLAAGAVGLLGFRRRQSALSN